MIEQDKVAEENLAKFVHDVVKIGTIFSLRGNEGFATLESMHFEHENGEPVSLICFWGSQEQALECKVDDWSDFEIAEITLQEFLENWCIGMENDRILAALNMNSEMEDGYEAPTLELILDVITELRKQEKSIELLIHKDIDDLEAQVADVLENGN